MIVGDSTSGKSMVIECLKSSLNKFDTKSKIID